MLLNEGREAETESLQKVSNLIASGTERKILILYFSQGDNSRAGAGVEASSSASIAYWNGELTGNAGIIARMIQENVGGRLFPILTKQKYPITYEAAAPIGIAEKLAKMRPELSSHIDNLNEYNTVFLVYPTWWYKMPTPLYTFFDEYDLSGKVIYVCVTSNQNGFTNELNEIRKMEPEAEVIRGLSFQTEETMKAKPAIDKWLDGIKASW